MWDKELFDLVLDTAPELVPRVAEVGDVGRAILQAWIDAREYRAELEAWRRLAEVPAEAVAEEVRA